MLSILEGFVKIYLFRLIWFMINLVDCKNLVTNGKLLF